MTCFNLRAMTKKFIFPTLAIFASVAALFSCVKENGPASEKPVCVSVDTIVVTATFPDALTKVSFAPEYDLDKKPSSIALTWDEGDALRVYDHADRNKYDDFTLNNGYAGLTSGKFSGTLANTSSATSYDVEVLCAAAFDYAAQTQPGDGKTTGLKYLASAKGISDLASVVFSEFSSVLAITAKMPDGVAGTIESVDITASEEIFNGGKTLSIEFASAGDADNDGILHFFATLPQGDTNVPAGTSLLLQFNAPGQTHDVYTRFVELDGLKLTANKLNTINVNASLSATHAGASSCDGTTAENAYLVGDKYQMLAMKSKLADNGITYFRQVADIDLSGIEWEPLNNADPYSKGINYDGGYHSIDNLSCTTGEIAYPSFAGILRGSVSNVTFKNAVIKCGDSIKGGVVAGYVGHKSKGYKANCSEVTVNNAKVTSTTLAGIFAAQGDNIGTLSGCQVVNNSSVSSSAGRVGGLIGSVVAFEEISDCYVEDATVSSDAYYAGGLVGQVDGGGNIIRCHSSGSVTAKHASYARSGGLVGLLISGNVSDCYSTCAVDVKGQFASAFVGEVEKNGTISKCYSTGSITSANHYCGGLVGRTSGTVNIEKSFFNGTISLPTGSTGKAQAGGIISYLDAGSKATISNCYTSGSWAGRRWFGGIIGGSKKDADPEPTLKVTNCFTTASITGSPYGALIGCNEIKGTITCSGLIAWWGSTINMAATGTAVSSDNNYIGQDGTISAKARALGWSTDIWDLSGDVPSLKPGSTAEEEPWSDEPTVVLPGATTVTICPGVEWTTFHGTWEGKTRNINIIRTTLNEHNSLGMYYNYTDEGYKFLDEKCDYLDAVAGTNGPMACCQFVRVNGTVKRGVPSTAQDPWIQNCAITIDDGNIVNIVKVDDNAAAKALPSLTVGCAGPLLVWDGEIQNFSSWAGEDFIADTHPRTAIGLSKDRKTVIQVTVDGRWTKSGWPAENTAIGLPVKTLAKLMKGLGCYKAMNLDGGGGAAMWVYGKGNSRNIVNHVCENRWNWNGTLLRETGSAVYIKSDLK